MKKSFVVIFFIFILDLFLAKYSFAATTTPSPTSSAVTATPAPQNPAPPIGIPCGKTVCLAGEECIQYPGDVDQHCVPMTPTPSLSPTISISPSPSPTPTIIPSAPLPPNCRDGNGVFPPNSTCWNDINEVQKNIKLYDKTCIYQPVVKYTDDREYRTGKQPFTQCGKGVGPHGEVGPGGDDPDCDVALLINTDVKNAELGSYGPSTPAEEFLSPDFLAQNYLYSSLFGRPLDLSDSPENNGEYPNREAYRTYWRLMPASNQANLRSFVMNMANDKKIDNIHFEFTDSNGQKNKTDFQTLYDQLSKQVILFWRFPFVRVGCLTQYPVCPEYAQATRELKPNFEVIRNLLRDLDLGPLVSGPLDIYESIISGPPFNGNLDGPYAAFVPLDFDSVRGYILKRKDEVEEETYTRFNYFNLPEYRLTNISFENIPYVGAVYQGLLSPKFGMIPALQPQWIVDKYSTPNGLTDYQLGNKPEDLPEVKIARKNFIDQSLEEIDALIHSPFGWLSDKIKSFFTDDDKKKGYIPAKEDVITNPLRVEEIRQVYDNPVGCPLPISYHELAPKTAAYSVDDHHQVVTIRGKNLEWSYTPSCSNLVSECKINPLTGLRECGTQFACTGRDDYIENGQCCTPAWSVDATKDAKALNVLNNPKQTDIKNVVAENQEYSFYSMMLPDGTIKVPEANIDAPIANHLYLKTAPTGNGEVLNPYEPINRISNLAQDSMHFLQNCWTIPKNLQNSPRCNLIFVTPEEASSDSCPVVDDSQVDSKLLGGFKSNFIDLANRWSAKCPGAEHNKAAQCYNFIASEAKKGGVNPAFALTIWLNESGASNYCEGGETTQDMGINLSSMYQNLTEQIKVFVNMAKQKLCDGQPGFVEPMHGWLSRFQSSRGVCDATDTVATQYYIDVMTFTWSVVTGCNSGGKFGITWPTDMSCP